MSVRGREWRFKRGPRFKKSLARLTPDEKRAARRAFALFQQNQFHPSLRTHQISILTAAHGKPVYSVRVTDRIRVLFVYDGINVVSLDIGSHDIYG